MHTMGRRPRVACVLARILVFLAAIAVPLGAQGAVVHVGDETGLRAAVANTTVREVVVTADMLLTAGELKVPPGRVLTLRGACGANNTSPCTLDASSLSRHIHVTPGAQVNVSKLILLNGSAINLPCDAFSQTMVPGMGLYSSTSQLN